MTLGQLEVARPLPSPLRRTARLVPAAVLLALAIPLVWGVRPDLSWPVEYTSILLLAAGIGLVGVALWDAIPGRNASARNLWWAACGAVVLFLAAMSRAAAVGRFSIPPGGAEHVARVCSQMPALLGLPILALVLYLVFRAFPVRPVWCGAIAGLGCGLIVESGWRTYCEFSSPIHILTTHGAAVAILAAIGAAAAWLYQKKL